MFKELDIDYKCAYLAGLFDGEGHITCWRSGIAGKPQVSIGITNTVEKPFKVAQEIFGGKISGRKRSIPNTKFIYEYRIRNEEALKFLQAIRPYCIIKLDKVKAAIRILKITTRKNKLGLNSHLIMERELEIFGSIVYIDNPNRYELKCIICGDEYKRRNTRGITCNASCRKLLSDKIRRGEISKDAIDQAKQLYRMSAI